MEYHPEKTEYDRVERHSMVGGRVQLGRGNERRRGGPAVRRADQQSVERPATSPGGFGLEKPANEDRYDDDDHSRRHHLAER